MFMVIETGTRQPGILRHQQIPLRQYRRPILVTLSNAVHAICPLQFMTAAPSQALIAAVKIRLLLKLTSMPLGIVEMGKGNLEAVKSAIQDSSSAAILPITVVNLISSEPVKSAIQDLSNAAIPPITVANQVIISHMRLSFKLNKINSIACS